MTHIMYHLPPYMLMFATVSGEAILQNYFPFQDEHIDRVIRKLLKIKLLLKQEHIYNPIYEQTITFYMALAAYAQQHYRQAHQL